MCYQCRIMIIYVVAMWYCRDMHSSHKCSVSFCPTSHALKYDDEKNETSIFLFFSVTWFKLSTFDIYSMKCRIDDYVIHFSPVCWETPFSLP